MFTEDCDKCSKLLLNAKLRHDPVVFVNGHWHYIDIQVDHQKDDSPYVVEQTGPTSRRRG